MSGFWDHLSGYVARPYWDGIGPSPSTLGNSPVFDIPPGNGMDHCITDHGIPWWYLGRVLYQMVIGTSEVCDGITHCLMSACQPL